MPVEEDLQTALAGSGVSVSGLVYREVSPWDSKRFPDFCYLNYFDVRNGVALAIDNNKANDGNPTASQLFPSEVVWQSWQDLAQDRSSGLRVMVQRIVTNEKSQRINFEAS